MPEDRNAFRLLLQSVPSPIQKRTQDFLNSIVFKSEYRVPAPATATTSGTVGQWAADSSYLYVCIADGTWRRVAIGSW